MRILHLTAGTGSFHCGTCTRDNALVNALRKQGHDASLLPLYLPFRLDQEESTDCPLFFEGINVYLQEKSAFFRRLPRWIDRLLDARFLLRWTARFQHMTRARDLGALTVSMLRAEEGNQSKELRRLIGWLRNEEPFDAVCLSNLLLAGLARSIRAELGIPVICTMQGEDTFLDGLPDPFRQKAWTLLAERAADCDAFVAVSEYYRREMLGRLGLREERTFCVPNGIVLDGFAPAMNPPSPPCIGYLSRMCPSKGLGLLVDAFIALERSGAHDDVRLLLMGTCTRGDEEYLQDQLAKLEEAGLSSLVSVHTNVSGEEKARLLRRMTLLSVPAVYGEAFGLYLLEALASGVPVVQPNRGAFTEIIGQTGGGWLYSPTGSEPEAAILARELGSALAGEAELRRRADRGCRVVRERFGIDTMADAVAEFYGRTIAGSADRNL